MPGLRFNWIRRDELFAMGLTGAWLVFRRLALDTPWGFHPTPAPGDMVNVGVVCNPTDTWSYLSWVQQYYHGANLAGLIYTTEPHPPLLWLFPLWLIGKFAALSGLSAIGTYNAAGVAGAMAAIFCLLRAAAALRLSPSARHWAAVAFVIGSGGSWLWHIAHKLGWAPSADGGDLFFLDLFPATTLVAYAYHAIGLALLTALWWITTELESRLLAKLPVGAWFTSVAIVALFLGFSRPYEPIAFLGAWLLKTSWHGLQRQRHPTEWKASAMIASVLIVALSPGIGWSLWVSTQPVWSSFARASLTLGLDRIAWLWALGGWAILAGLGIREAKEATSRVPVSPVAASLLLILVIFGLGSAHAKLSSGLIAGPLVLSGWGAVRIIKALERCGKIRIGLAAISLCALFGVPSLFMNLHAMKLRGPALVDAEVVALAHLLPFTVGQPPPVVLTDADTGSFLPGLSGARVWAGHWSLTNDYQAKVGKLKMAGLDPEIGPKYPLQSHATLSAILSETKFDYALIDRRCAGMIADLASRGWRTQATMSRRELLQAPPTP